MVRLVALTAVAAWSILPPYVAPVEVAADVEVIDHVVPGAIAVAAALYVLRAVARGGGGTTAVLGAMVICALTGIWQLVTHLGLLLDAGDAQRPLGRVLLHFTPGPVIAALSLWLLWDLSSEERG